MSLDEQLRDAFRKEVESRDAQQLDVFSVMSRGLTRRRHARIRRTTGAVLSLVVVAAGVAVLSLDGTTQRDDDSAPATVSDLLSGRRPECRTAGMARRSWVRARRSRRNA